MVDNKKTIYSSLNSMLNLDGIGFADSSKEEGKKVIIKGNSPQDIKRKALELQQKKSLEQKFFKTADHGFQKAMQYEAARLPAYLDYEGMEYYPLIASAMDLMMEEATTIGDNGNMLNIYSDKERIREQLQEFFYDTVNVNVNLPFWIRNLVKYGDNFVYLLGEKNKGIKHVKQLVNYEIERVERINNGKATVKFKQRESGDEFNLFEIAHFRLLGDDKYLPYGSSILNKVRRVFRQLIMAEDAMLTYRIIRAGEKRIFKIDVGNIDEDDIEAYMHKVASKFKKQQQIYPDSGQIDYRFNILGNDEDFFIPVRNANVQTGIDTLPGAQNLDQIQDIEYLRDNLFTGLGIPKAFLGFQDTAGDGKNMAQADIRFAKKINRIQQAAIQELNKMAIIHLYLLGYSKEDLNNFTLTLTNPSTQADILKTELWQSKAQLYTEITRNEGGIAAMSHTNARRFIFNMSDKEIIEDYKNQRMERAMAQELQDSPLIIRSTGIFDDIDDKYGSGETPPEGGMEGDEEGGAPSPPGEGEGLGGPQSPADLPPIEGAGGGLGEGKKPKENKIIVDLSENGYEQYLDKLVSRNDPKRRKIETEKKVLREKDETFDKNKLLNEKAQEMAGEIDGLINEGGKFNSKKAPKLPNYKDINKLENFDLDEIDLNSDDQKEG